MAVLERGGNAFDAAVATGFVLQVVEPHLNGPGGEVPAVFWSAEHGEPLALCGQGVAPAAATIERFHELGHELIPGTGVLAACVPGSFGGWLLLLRDYGTWPLVDVLEFAIGYAEHGYPLHERIRATIELNEALIASWPGSRDLYLPAPEAGRALPQPRPRGDVPTHRRRESRRLTRGRDREGARRVLRGLRRRGDRPVLRCGGRTAHGGGPGGVARDDRARRQLRLPRAHGVQDAAVGRRPGWPPAARAAPGLRSRRAVDGRARPRRRRVRKARVRRSRRALRRRGGGAARDAALERVQRRASTARRRRRLGGVQARARPAALATRRGGDHRLRRAGTRRPCTSTSRIASGT